MRGHPQPSTTTPRPIARTLEVELHYLDLTTCTRCVGSDANLTAALAIVQPALDALGLSATVRRAHVTSVAEAERLGLVSSPTIRINGRDIAPRLQESACAPCSEHAGQATACRVWTYQGQDFTEAPVGAIVEALLAAAAGGEVGPAPLSAPTASVPENLQRFFAGRDSAATAPCCSATEQAACCAPEDKTACCGAPGSGQCGCR